MINTGWLTVERILDKQNVFKSDDESTGSNATIARVHEQQRSLEEYYEGFIVFSLTYLLVTSKKSLWNITFLHSPLVCQYILFTSPLSH